jgi:glycosyltransferase involved in cell wall biosynthesis
LKVSVIIPVLNLEKFIGRAIASVLIQDEVVECLVIDDGSTDRTREICDDYAAQDHRVKVLSHAWGANLGVSASRNLGLKKAGGDYISFLDGDDYYLENRFEKAKAAFQINPMIDGVYEAMISETNLTLDNPPLTTITKDLIPDELFSNMAPFGSNGHFSICALTVKRTSALAVEPFHESISIVEDSLWIAQLSLDFILVPGDLKKPVVVRGLHDFNSSKNLEELREQRVKMCLHLLDWATKNAKSEFQKTLITKVLLRYQYEHNRIFSKQSQWSKKLSDLRFLMQLYRIDPNLFKSERVKYLTKLALHIPVKSHINFYE